MKKHFYNILKFLSLLDESNNLSITNILIIALTIKIMVTSNVDYASAAGLIGAIINYGHKRHVNGKRSQDISLLDKKIEENQTFTQSVSTRLDGIIQTLNVNSRTR